MPRAPSDNTEAINMKIPPAWIEKADALRRGGAVIPGASITRTAMFRVALGYGLDALLRERSKHAARQRRRVRKGKGASK